MSGRCLHWIALIMTVAVPAHAHPGGLDRNGCHHDRRRGGYHCHGGSGGGGGGGSPARGRRARGAQVVDRGAGDLDVMIRGLEQPAEVRTGGGVTRVGGPGTAVPPTPAPSTASPWTSPEACAALTRAMPARPADDPIRVGSWNLRWFPDGSPGRTSTRVQPTNVEWLACTIAAMRLDVLAVQEVLQNESGRRGLARLIEQLDRHTGGQWQQALDGCAGDGFLHVGLLWNRRRVEASQLAVIGVINPRGSIGPDGVDRPAAGPSGGACVGGLRPAMRAYFRRTGGGADFAMLAVHLDSGTEQRDYDNRRRSVAAIARLFGEVDPGREDDDVIVAGDFNTMGCADCSPRVSAEEEVALLERELGSPRRPFRRARASGCTQRSSRGPARLDHVFATSWMRELLDSPAPRVDGYCALGEAPGTCGPRSPARAETELSDHCPVVVAVRPTDDDETPLPESASRTDIAEVLTRAGDSVRACAPGRQGIVTAQIEFVSSGAVNDVMIRGPWAGTPEGACMERALRRARLPPFRRPTLRVSFPFRLDEPRP
ncbi:MAG: endonuclease/exonuclease/phosphatase family protein [Deltaproteobacteria bacterium]|nr:endonuclease/exonuclease/phosphatase family protein [Deltaproteobacteria bacterium]